MNKKPEMPHRRSLRLKGYDYTQPGAYFITIVTQNRSFLFGNIIDGEMHLNDAGKMVDTAWQEIPSFYPGIEIDAFQIMPNHVHGIIILSDSVGAPSQNRIGTSRAYPLTKPGQPRGVAPTTNDDPIGKRATAIL